MTDKNFCHWNIYYDTPSTPHAYRISATMIIMDTTGERFDEVMKLALDKMWDVSELLGETVSAFSVTKKWFHSKFTSCVAYCDLDENNYLKVPKSGYGKGFEDGSVFKKCQVNNDKIYKIIDTKTDEIVKENRTLAEAKLDAKILGSRKQHWMRVEKCI